VNDLAEQTPVDYPLAASVYVTSVILEPAEKVAAEEKPAEEMAMIRECEYCGHYPCGCGG